MNYHYHEVPLRFTQEHADILPPTYAKPGDSGFDLRAAVPLDGVTLYEVGYVDVPTGLRFDVPEGYELQIRPRSGLSGSIRLLNAPGTVDSGYRGEVKLRMAAQPGNIYHVKRNERIAQAVLAPVVRAGLIQARELGEETARGSSGFGSTGKF